MKYVTIVYACIICLILCILAFGVSVMFFPIALLVEVCILIKEVFTDDRWEHNIYGKFVQGLFICIKEAYNKITEKD